MRIPTIDTARLRLRGCNRDDLERYLEIWSEPFVARYTIGKPPTREAAWARFLRVLGHWHLMGFGFWALEEAVTGKLLGDRCHRKHRIVEARRQARR